MAQLMPLTAASFITTNEANLLFYRGIPSKLRKKIKGKIPEAHQTVASPPSIASVLGYLIDEFDIDDIDDSENLDDIALASDSDEDMDTDDDLDVVEGKVDTPVYFPVPRCFSVNSQGGHVFSG